MLTQERFRLRFGRYETPEFRYGARVTDAARGQVRIVGLSGGRIPWPIGKANGAKSLVLYKGLARALSRESGPAVCHWWGIAPCTVRNWKRLLGVSGDTDGTRAVRSLSFLGTAGKKARAAGVLKSRDPARRAKISAALRGKRRSAAVVEKMRQSKLGTRHTDETRRKMSEAHRRRGTRPPKAGRPWSAAEDALLSALPSAEAARKTKRTVNAVKQRRWKLRQKASA
ncbi:MAG TPA: NUMOD3 domain-containing DNA-binding protein [Pirellulales bacterium]